MTRLAIVLALSSALLSGCSANFQREYSIERQCRIESGPEPLGGMLLLGVVGAMGQMSNSDWRTWRHDVDACKARMQTTTASN